MFEMILSLDLPRKDKKSYRHVAYITITEDNADDVREQYDELKEEYPSIKIQSSNLPD